MILLKDTQMLIQQEFQMDKDLFGMLQQQDLKQVHLVEQLVDTKTLQQDLQ